jgi:hypothetical protein
VIGVLEHASREDLAAEPMLVVLLGGFAANRGDLAEAIQPWWPSRCSGVTYRYQAKDLFGIPTHTVVDYALSRTKFIARPAAWGPAADRRRKCPGGRRAVTSRKAPPESKRRSITRLVGLSPLPESWPGLPCGGVRWTAERPRGWAGALGFVGGYGVTELTEVPQLAMASLVPPQVARVRVNCGGAQLGNWM